MKKRVSIVLAVVFCAMMLPGYTAYAGVFAIRGPWEVETIFKM